MLKATLRAGVNSFSGMIPNEITNLTNLQELSFEETWLYGELPHEIGKMKSLGESFLLSIYSRMAICPHLIVVDQQRP
jgi:hypothetical protein